MIVKFRLLLIILIVFMANALFTAGYSPTNPANEGAISYYLSSTAPYTTSYTDFGGIRIANDDSKWNFVRSLNGSILVAPVRFEDKDYSISDNNVYSEITNTSDYLLSMSGFPTNYIPSTRNAFGMGSYGVSGSFYGAPVGVYPITFTATDLGDSANNNIVDSSKTIEANVYIVAFNDTTQTIRGFPNDVKTIDFGYTPNSFPDEGICYIAVSWGTYIPGFPPPASNLYTDSACTTAITSNQSNAYEMRWNLSSAPTQIYFKHPSDTTNSYAITVKLMAVQSSQQVVIDQKTITYVNTDIKLRSVNSVGHLKGYWDGAYQEYPDIEWEDSDGDGVVKDLAGVADEKNKPFIFSKDTNPGITSVVFDKLSSLSPGTLSVTSSDSSINNTNITYTTSADKLTTNAFTSSSQLNNKIAAKNVTLTWTMSSRVIGTTNHKVYVIGGTHDPGDPDDPDNPYEPYFHTLVDLGCTAANEKSASDQSVVFNAIWNKFKTLSINRIDGAGPIKYWGDYAGLVNDTPGMLYRLDGRCGTWAEFFKDTMKIQGINNVGTSQFYISGRIRKVDSNGIYYWEKIVNGVAWKVELKQEGTSFQGGGVPNAAHFADHVINVYDGKYYDVTCGVGPYDSLDLYIQANAYIKWIPINLGTEYEDHDLTIADFTEY